MRKKKKKEGAGAGPKKAEKNGFFTFSQEERKVVVDLLFEDLRIAAEKNELQNKVKEYTGRRQTFFDKFAKRIGVATEQLDGKTLTETGISIIK